MKRENPGLSPGAPELSLILGSGPYGGVSGDGVPCSQRTNSSNISVGGWGCYPVRLTATFRAGALPYFHYAFGQRIRYFGIRTTTPLLLEVRPQMPSPRENGNQLGSSPRPSACRAIPSPCPPASFGCSCGRPDRMEPHPDPSSAHCGGFHARNGTLEPLPTPRILRAARAGIVERFSRHRGGGRRTQRLACPKAGG
jgi:hypothetical protein